MKKLTVKKIKVTESMLTLDDYDKKARPKDNPDVKGGKERAEFNRKQDWEVAPMVEKVINRLGLNKKSINTVEVIIRDDLPGDIRKHDEVENWLCDNYKKKRLDAYLKDI